MKGKKKKKKNKMNLSNGLSCIVTLSQLRLSYSISCTGGKQQQQQEQQQGRRKGILKSKNLLVVYGGREKIPSYSLFAFLTSYYFRLLVPYSYKLSTVKMFDLFLRSNIFTITVIYLLYFVSLTIT